MEDSQANNLVTLVLPFGAVGGARIVLDGINGVIQLFDANGDLREQFKPTNLSTFLELFPTPEPGHAFDSGGVGGGKSGSGNTVAGTLSLQTPSVDAKDRCFVLLIGETADGLTKPVFRVDTLPGGEVQLATGRCSIESTGDLQIGTHSFPRGRVGENSRNTSVALSNTSGTFTDLITAAAVPLVLNREYEVTFQGFDLLSGGSAFAVTDQWLFELQTDDSGAFVTIGGIKWNAGITVASRYPIWTLTGSFIASATHTANVKARATRNAGAATVTSSVEADATHPISIWVKDIGA